MLFMIQSNTTGSQVTGLFYKRTRWMQLRLVGALTILLAVVTTSLAQDEQERQAAQVIQPDIVDQSEMRNFLHDLNEIHPVEAISLLESFADEHNLDREARPEAPEDIYEIIIDDRRFVPEPGIDPELQDLVDEAQDEDFVTAFLQLEEMPSINDYIDLMDLGVRGLFKRHWIGHSTFLVSFRAEVFPGLEDMEKIRWLGHYAPEAKVHVEFEEIETALINPIDSDRPEYQSDLEELGIRIDHYDESLNKFVGRLQEDQTEELAQLWWVRSIEFMQTPELQNELPDDDVPQKVQVQDSRLMSSAERTWLFREGEGVEVGMIDTRPDEDHDGFDDASIMDGSDTGTGSHGTHVGGTIAAVQDDNSNITGEYGARGMAPEASLYSVDLDGDDFYTGAVNRFLDEDIRLSNHSWAFRNSQNVYNAHTENFDEFARNNGTFVFAAGNDGSGEETVLSPSTGKNVLTVGSLRYVTDDDRTDREIGGPAVYSSRGPAQDRLKPEIVAPGGQTIRDYPHYKYGVVSLNPQGNTGDDVWPEDDDYLRMSGTSMAAPHVTGAMALMKEKWPDLSSEALKARVLGTTIPIEDNSEDPAAGYANTDVGYGLLNAYNAAGIYMPGESERLGWWHATLTAGLFGSDQHTVNFDVPQNTEKLMVTLVYNDRAGAGGELINELNLELSDGSSTYSTTLPDGVSEESTVKKRIVENPSSGDWSANVKFKNPGIFGFQDYSVFAYAVKETPELEISSVTGTAYAQSGQDFTTEMTIENTEGWIAAGVTGWLEGDDFGGQVDLTKNARNLKFEGASETVAFEVEAPHNKYGLRELEFCTDGINMGLDPVCKGEDVYVGEPPEWIVDLEPIDRSVYIGDRTGIDMDISVWNLEDEVPREGSELKLNTTLGNFDGETSTTEELTEGAVQLNLSPGEQTGIGELTASMDMDDKSLDVTKFFVTPEDVQITRFAEETFFGDGLLRASDITGGDINVYTAADHLTATAVTYSENPVETPDLEVVSNFAEIHLDHAERTEGMKIEIDADGFGGPESGFGPNDKLHFWNGSEWVAFSEQEFLDEPSVVATVTQNTTPSLEEFTGTEFTPMAVMRSPLAGTEPFALETPRDEFEVNVEGEAEEVVEFHWERPESELSDEELRFIWMLDQEGDFIDPDFELEAENDGRETSRVVTYEQFDEFMDEKDVEEGEAFEGIWTAAAVHEGDTQTAEESHEVTLVRGEVTSIEEITEVPDEFSLDQNHPNPFNPSTQISYSIPEHSHVRLEVYDSIGQHVTTLVDDEQSPGRYEVTFDAGDLSSGMYLYRLETGSFTETKQMMFIK